VRRSGLTPGEEFIRLTLPEEETMRRIAMMGMLIAVVMLCVGLWAAAQEKPEVVEVTGILVKVSGVGTDSTGWEMHLPNEVNIDGKMTKSVEVQGDPHKFQKLENLRITVKGIVMHPSGDRIVIKVQKIKE
jgi:hypothetical protein